MTVGKGLGLLAAAWLLARKDLRLYFRDRTGMLLGFLLPVALVTVFGFVMKAIAGGGEEAMPRVRLWVSDLDRSAASRALIEELRRTESLSLRPAPGAEDAAPASAEQARRWVAEGEEEAHHVLLIPDDYEEALAAGRLPELEIVRDPGRKLESQMVGIGVMQAFLAQTEGRYWPLLMGRRLEEAGMAPEQSAALVGFLESARALLARFLEQQVDAAGAGATATAPPAGDAAAAAEPAVDLGDFTSWMSPASFVDVPRSGRPSTLTYQLAQVVAGMTVMMLMFGLMACATTLIEERDRGTLRRLYVAPVPRASVLLSKFLLAGVVGLLQLVVLFSYGEAVFRVHMFRDPITLAVLSLSTVAAVGGFGMLVASASRTVKQAEGLSTLIILVMSAVGGAWFPVQYFEDRLPGVAQVAMRCTLTHWAMSGYQGMLWYGHGWLDAPVLGSLAVLWSFALAAATASLLLSRR